MNPESNHITVSTDVLGLLANPKKVQQAYEQAGFNCGLEVVLMTSGRKMILDMSRGHGFPSKIDGVHIRLGSSPPKSSHFRA